MENQASQPSAHTQRKKESIALELKTVAREGRRQNVRMETTGKRIAERKSQIGGAKERNSRRNEEEGGSRERRRREPQEESRTAERQQGARVTKHPGTQAKKEQETPRSNKSWRQVETTPQPKERTVQRTVTPQEEGEGQERDRRRR